MNVYACMDGYNAMISIFGSPPWLLLIIEKNCDFFVKLDLKKHVETIWNNQYMEIMRRKFFIGTLGALLGLVFGSFWVEICFFELFPHGDLFNCFCVHS
mmetsp:Transcript_7709/g.8937  ORF Transcript_7709/g.8937 Transcript_7709/m.8937 type:complete len:99 (+) Transcript_7709:2-298(+)